MLTGRSVEPLRTLQRFPVYMGCTDQPRSRDVVADMAFGICPATGIIQLTRLLPLELVYLGQHNDATGAVWREHHDQFVAFLRRFSPHTILEIGGGSGYIAHRYLAETADVHWTIVEPNPNIAPHQRLRVQPGWFDQNFNIDFVPEAVVHTHVLEHMYNPVSFIQHVSDFLPAGALHLFSFPNMYEQLTGRYANCLNFEHTCLLREAYVDVMLVNAGFTILTKHHFKQHSIFYAVQKTRGTVVAQPYPNLYHENKELFASLMKETDALVADWNSRLRQEERPVYLFGAHIFSQWLVSFGLTTSPLVSVLDNSPLKIGQRLYGTHLQVDSPQVLKDTGPAVVLLRAGSYNEEIKTDIRAHISPDIEFWE